MQSNAAARAERGAAPAPAAIEGRAILQPVVRKLVAWGLDYYAALELMRRQYIYTLLQENAGNMCAAAAAGGIHRNTLALIVRDTNLTAWLKEFRRDVAMQKGRARASAADRPAAGVS